MSPSTNVRKKKPFLRRNQILNAVKGKKGVGGGDNFFRISVFGKGHVNLPGGHSVYVRSGSRRKRKTPSSHPNKAKSNLPPHPPPHVPPSNLPPQGPPTFHFLEEKTEANHQQQSVVLTKSMGNYRCPICKADGVNGEGILKHLKSEHAHDHDIKQMRTVDGTLHISVGTKRKSDKLHHDDHPPVIPEVEPPLRNYYHPESMQTIKVGEWMHDIDSDDEVDESWKHRMACSMMDEFDDVSGKEKIFFQMWNEFMQLKVMVRQSHLPRHCMEFVCNSFGSIHELDLEEQLVWHLTNMWDEGHISRNHIIDVLTKYRELIPTEDTSMRKKRRMTTIADGKQQQPGAGGANA